LEFLPHLAVQGNSTQINSTFFLSGWIFGAEFSFISTKVSMQINDNAQMNQAVLKEDELTRTGYGLLTQLWNLRK
jgi:hypothetical protein